MDKSIITVLLVFCGVLWSLSMNAQNEKTLTGEVLDLSCYLTNGAKGPGHAACAKACLKNGHPMGLLTDEGDVYLLTFNKSDDAPFQALKELGGEMVKIKGTQSDRDGMSLVVVMEAEKKE